VSRKYVRPTQLPSSLDLLIVEQALPKKAVHCTYERTHSLDTPWAGRRLDCYTPSARGLHAGGDGATSAMPVGENTGVALACHCRRLHAHRLAWRAPALVWLGSLGVVRGTRMAQATCGGLARASKRSIALGLVPVPCVVSRAGLLLLATRFYNKLPEHGLSHKLAHSQGQSLELCNSLAVVGWIVCEPPTTHRAR